MTPLMQACKSGHAKNRGHLDNATVLIDAGAKLDLQNTKGQTALYMAAHENHPALVGLLANRGADLTLKCTWETVPWHDPQGVCTL